MASEFGARFALQKLLTHILTGLFPTLMKTPPGKYFRLYPKPLKVKRKIHKIHKYINTKYKIQKYINLIWSCLSSKGPLPSGGRERRSGTARGITCVLGKEGQRQGEGSRREVRPKDGNRPGPMLSAKEESERVSRGHCNFPYPPV